MSQFPMTDSRRKALERFPDYAVEITCYEGTVTVKTGGTVIAKTNAALLIQKPGTKMSTTCQGKMLTWIY